MSYSSRVYRQRNAHAHDDTKKEQFFSKQHDRAKTQKAGTVQTKLAVNKPGDSYEKEADAAATQVVNNKAQSPAVQQKEISSIQRETTPKKEEKKMQAKEIQRAGKEPEKEKDKVQKMDQPKKEEEKKNAVQKKTEPAKEKKKVQAKEEPKKEEEDKKAAAPVQRKETAGASAPVEAQIDQAKGKGNHLPSGTLQEMNTGFGVDFSNVRIHNDTEAAQLSDQLEAQAFTHGGDIYFNEGKFDPASSSGRLLLAHELTHTIQQGAVSAGRQAPAQSVAQAKANETEGASVRDHALMVGSAIDSGNWADDNPPGAFYLLHSLAWEDMIRVLHALTATQRNKLLSNLGESASGFNSSRLHQALMEVSSSAEPTK